MAVGTALAIGLGLGGLFGGRAIKNARSGGSSGGSSGGTASGRGTVLGGASTGEDPEAAFRRIIGNKPLTIATFRSIESELNAAGLFLEYRGGGTRANLVLPSGEVVDVVRSFSGPLSGRELQFETSGRFLDSDERDTAGFNSSQPGGQPGTEQQPAQFEFNGETLTRGETVGTAVRRDGTTPESRGTGPGSGQRRRSTDPRSGGTDPDNISGVLTDAEQQAAARAAQLQQRKKSSGRGRRATLLGGFSAGSPATRPATLLGR